MHRRIFFKLNYLVIFTLMQLAPLSPVLAKTEAVKALDTNLVKSESIEDILKKTFSKAMVGATQGTATLKMILTNASGVKKERTLKFKSIDEGNLLQFLIKFEKPADVKGTAFLVKERKGQLPDQYIYIPAMKTVRRVAAGNATGSFFGSDFIYADLLPYPEESKKDVEVIKQPDQTLDNKIVYVAQIVPKNAESPYGKLLIFIDKANYVAQKIEFFDRKDKLLKILKALKLEKIAGKLTPVEIQMENVQTKTSTTIIISDINPSAKLTADDFTTAAMQRS